MINRLCFFLLFSFSASTLSTTVEWKNQDFYERGSMFKINMSSYSSAGWVTGPTDPMCNIAYTSNEPSVCLVAVGYYCQTTCFNARLSWLSLRGTDGGFPFGQSPMDCYLANVRPSYPDSVNAQNLMDAYNGIVGSWVRMIEPTLASPLKIRSISSIPVISYTCTDTTSSGSGSPRYFRVSTYSVLPPIPGPDDDNVCAVLADVVVYDFDLSTPLLDGASRSNSLSYNCSHSDAFVAVSLLSGGDEGKIKLDTNSYASVQVNGSLLGTRPITVLMHRGNGVISIDVTLHGTTEKSVLTASPVLLFQPL